MIAGFGDFSISLALAAFGSALGTGVAGLSAIGAWKRALMSAFMQGKAGAKAADALAETGKGFGNYIMVLGIIETVALFVMVFTMTALPRVS